MLKKRNIWLITVILTAAVVFCTGCSGDTPAADGNIATSRVSVDVPATWEVLPRYPEETFFYLKPEQTREYVYPGDGTTDYTVYVTNVAG